MILSQYSSGCSAAGLRRIVPALLTRMSIRGTSRLICSMNRCSALRSEKSQAYPRKLRPVSRTRFVTGSSSPPSVALTPTMSAPASASPTAIASPIPRRQPVTSAVFPERLNISIVFMSIDSFALESNRTPEPTQSFAACGLAIRSAKPQAVRGRFMPSAPQIHLGCIRSKAAHCSARSTSTRTGSGSRRSTPSSCASRRRWHCSWPCCARGQHTQSSVVSRRFRRSHPTSRRSIDRYRRSDWGA